MKKKMQKWSEVAQQVKSVLKDYPKLWLTQGRKVYIFFLNIFYFIKIYLIRLTNFDMVCI
jgi:hypothetical protein